MTSLYKALRLLQAALLLAALLTGLSLFEEKSPAMQETGQQELSLEVQAPVENPKGPWDEGMVFTGEHEGIPPHVAPRLMVHASHTAIGIDVGNESWSSAIVFEARGEGGDVWWSTRQAVPLNVSGDDARLEIDLSSVVADAEAMDEAADVPSRLSIMIEIEHQATRGDGVTKAHLASVDLIPREGFVATELRGDSSTVAEPAEEQRNWLPIALIGGALVAEGPAWFVRRGRDPWEDTWGASAREVEGLTVPEEAPRASVEDVVAIARDRSHPVLVDREQGVILAAGDPPIWSSIEGERVQP